MTVTIQPATNAGVGTLSNTSANLILRNQNIPAAPVTVNFTTWLANSPFCAPPSSSPCSSLQFGQNQQIVVTVDPAGGAWNVQPGGMVNGANTSAQVPITCAPSASLPFSPLPQVFVTDFFIHLTQNCTLTSVTGPFVQGSEIVITTINDGGFTLGFPASFINTPPIQTGVNAYNAMTFQYCGAAGTVACPAGDWNNTDIGPAGALPTLDAVLNPVNNASFTFLATEGLTVAGTQPASVSGAGIAAGPLVSMTTAQGGNSTSGTGGAGGDYIWITSTGGNSTTGRARGGNFWEKIALSGAAGTGAANPGQSLVDYDSTGITNGTWSGGSNNFPTPNNGPGKFVRNVASTAGNTVNNFSPALGMCAHMQINSIDTLQCGNQVLFPGDPSASSMVINNGNNPHITWLFEIPSNGFSPTYHFCFMQGAGCISTTNGGAGVGANGYFWSAGAGTIVGNDPSGALGQGQITLWPAQPGNGSVGIQLQGRGSAGTVAGCIDDDLKNTNGTMVFCNLMNNSSGGNIADGTVVKAGTANSVTPVLTTDTGANIVLGIVIVPGGGNCASATKCFVAWGGNLNGVVKMGTASCAIGNAVIVDTTTGGEVKCIAAGSATQGTIIGMAMSAQATPGNTVDVAIRIH